MNGLNAKPAARTLFARVLDAPGGGLRIQTIHGFCQGLLAAFPVEAGRAPRLPPPGAGGEGGAGAGAAGAGAGGGRGRGGGRGATSLSGRAMTSPPRR